MFKPNVTVACLVVCDNSFVLVKEKDKQTGKTVFNQPAGHLEAHENLMQACCRELFEETGLEFEPNSLLGIHLLEASNQTTYLRFSFLLEIPGTQKPHLFPQDREILSARWYSSEEIIALRSQLRSPMIEADIESYRLGQRADLALFKTYYA
ncbi:NUDIX domain-containing protein [Algicola sagamiensis]|uniref:NUDIX domain-containing protein n=1 Tax=Algicola sagamiensis TaxID=163869 RepID=UPI00037B5258|nr:NUDIX domain-containing protein [Algicola sagamiensis]